MVVDYAVTLFYLFLVASFFMKRSIVASYLIYVCLLIRKKFIKKLLFCQKEKEI